MDICSNIDGLSVMLSGVRQTEEVSHDVPYMWNPKRNDTNELTKQKETHRLRKLTYSCQGEGIVRECKH